MNDVHELSRSIENFCPTWLLINHQCSFLIWMSLFLKLLKLKYINALLTSILCGHQLYCVSQRLLNVYLMWTSTLLPLPRLRDAKKGSSWSWKWIALQMYIFLRQRESYPIEFYISKKNWCKQWSKYTPLHIMKQFSTSEESVNRL